MENVATSVEQSKELLELGVDPNTASMIYTPLDNWQTPWVWNGKPLLEAESIPAWTLADLISLLPCEITVEEPTAYRRSYRIYIDKTKISYLSVNTLRLVPVMCLYSFTADTLIGAAVKAIVELKKLKRM